MSAMLLGAGSVVGVDIEEDSIRVSRENAERNGIPAERFTLRRGNVLQDVALRETIRDGYDVVVANIVADVVIAMCPLFREYLKKSGTLITSGIITERLEDVKAAVLAAGFVIKKISEKGEWAAITAAWK